jgi:hypothetical protein
MTDNGFKTILDNMTTYTWQQKKARKHMQGIQSRLRSKSKDQKKINQLTVTLDEIDRRHNLNWQKTFPWLVKELERVV